MTKKIICTGNLRSDFYTKANIAEMEAAAAFNGVVIQSTYNDPVTNLSFLLNHVSHPFSIPYKLLEPSEQTIGTTNFKAFKHNFIRVNLAEPGLTWLFDPSERDSLVNNCRMCARLAKNSAITGILFDMEAYSNSKFWNYSALSALHPNTNTFDHYRYKYYDVGYQVGEELAEEYYNITLAIAISFEQLRSIPRASLPSNRYGLLPSFLNGLHDGIGFDAKIINTLEDGYANRVEADFDYDLRIQKEPPYLASGNYKKAHLPGMSIWCDYPGASFDFNDASKNYNTPHTFEDSLNLALQKVDWLFCYSQQINWDKQSINSSPPKSYLDALSRVSKYYKVATVL